MKKLSIIILLALSFVPTIIHGQTQTPVSYFGAIPDLKVDGKEIVAKKSDGTWKAVTLHGVMDTPNAYFNGNRWCNGIAYPYYNQSGAVEAVKKYFTKIFQAIANPTQGTYCNLFRLHLDPAWTNDPSKTATNGGGENDISRFSADRLRTYLESLYIPIAEDALAHGLYVIIRPPGVFPEDVTVGDAYNEYLKTVWDIISQNTWVKDHSGQVMLELGNEPVRMSGNLADYFQPVVNKIRQNGFTGILLLPGTSYQADYRDYATKPISDSKDNYGYAVHNYPGWYGGWVASQTEEEFISTFETQVPVASKPIVITEVDWSPMKEGAGHWNELHTQYTEGNFGTWATGTTSSAPNVPYKNTQNTGWGMKFKHLVDKYPNISWTLQGTTTLVDMDKYLHKAIVAPAFEDAMKAAGYEDASEACSKTCMEWFKEYACGNRIPEGTPNVLSEVITYYTSATTSGTAKYDDVTARYYFPTTYSCAFIFNEFNGTRLDQCGDLVIKLGEGTVGYRLDVQLKTKDAEGKDQIIKIPYPTTENPNATQDFILGTPEAGTKLSTFSDAKDAVYNLQTLFASYLEQYPDCTIGEIRINTAAPEANDGVYWFTIDDMQLETGTLSVRKKSEDAGTSLANLKMYEYVMPGDADKTKELTATEYENKIGKNESATTIYGLVTPDKTKFVDVTGYKSLTFQSDADVRVFINCTDQQNVVTVSANGTLDLSQYPYAHINAIKGKDYQTSAKVSSATLKDKNNNDVSLSSLKFCEWTFKEEGKIVQEKSNSKLNTGVIQANSVVYGPENTGSVLHNQYVDVSDYKTMLIKGSGSGTLRVMFNRLYEEGPLTEIQKTFENNMILIDLESIDQLGYAHLNSIKTKSDGGSVTIDDIIFTKESNPTDNIADYYISGAGHKETGVDEALADENATVIDITGYSGKLEYAFESANPNCLLIYNQGTNVGSVFGDRNMVKSTDNSSYKIDLVDGFDFRAPFNISTYLHAQYTRDLGATKTWGTTVIPFALNVAAAGSPYIYVLSSQDDTKLHFRKVTEGTIPAGSIILYYKAAGGEAILSGKNIAQTVEGFNIQPVAGVNGWYTAQSYTHQVIDDVTKDPVLKDYDVYAVSNNKFVRATKKLTLKPFRALYLHKKSGSGSAKANFELSLDDDSATDIQQSLNLSEAREAEVYDITGRRISSTQSQSLIQGQRGIYIIRMPNGTVRKVLNK